MEQGGVGCKWMEMGARFSDTLSIFDDEQTSEIVWFLISTMQKQPSIGIFRKRYSENMQ